MGSSTFFNRLEKGSSQGERVHPTLCFEDPAWLLINLLSDCSLQNTSQNLLGEALAQHIRQKIDGRGDHQLSHYNLIGVRGNRMGTSHVSVLGEDGSAVAATSTINTPCVGPGKGRGQTGLRGRWVDPSAFALDSKVSFDPVWSTPSDLSLLVPKQATPPFCFSHCQKRSGTGTSLPRKAFIWWP